MDTTPRPTVLCVDDEPQVLAGLSLHLRRRYEVVAATGGPAGLEALKHHPHTAVVVSDMRMPGMDGATFLAHAREMAPMAVRILLSGQADVDSAIAAVNFGQVFRFLTKPCPPPVLLGTVQSAVEHHRLITGERVLLEQTLRSTVAALTDVLALASPMAFGRAARLRRQVVELGGALRVEPLWQLEIAAMLSQAGFVTLPHPTLEKVYLGKALSEAEQAMVERVPAVTDELLANIPRLDPVRKIIRTAGPPFLGFGAILPGELYIRRAANVLHLASDADRLETLGHSPERVLELLRARSGVYESHVLDTFGTLSLARLPATIAEIHLPEARVGMVLAQDVWAGAGTLLVARGVEVTSGLVERLENMKWGSVDKPVRMIVSSGAASAVVRAGDSAA